MAEYCLGILRRYGRIPRQVVFYIGESPLRMVSELRGPDLMFRYRAIDARSMDGDALLESEDIGDNVIAILAGLRDPKGGDPEDPHASDGAGRGRKETRFGAAFDFGGAQETGENCG